MLAMTWTIGFGPFPDASLAADLRDSTSTSGGILFIFGNRTFVPISWICKNHTAVSHNRTEAEIFSFDCGSPDPSRFGTTTRKMTTSSRRSDRCSSRKFEERNVEEERRTNPPSTSLVTQKTCRTPTKLILSCNQLCMFLSVAKVLDDQPELSFAVTERDLNVSETLREPPLNPLADKAGGGGRRKRGGKTPTPRTGDTNTALRTHHTRNFSRAWRMLALQCSLCAFSPKSSSSRAHVMFRTLLDPPLTSPTLSTPTTSSPLFISNRPATCSPPTGLLFGRSAEQSPLSGYHAPQNHYSYSPFCFGINIKL